MIEHTAIDFAAIRNDFPHTKRKPWLAASEFIPFNIHSMKAIEAYATTKSRATGGYGFGFTPQLQAEAKENFAKLINASADEIAFVQSTTEGENIIIAGLDLARRGGNVVIDDLHFEASKYMYTQMEEAGLIELRIVEHEGWTTSAADYAKYIDQDTRLVSIALVSQMNGYLADVAAISQLAHDHGAWLYADVIQAAGNSPIDVEAMGIDFASTSTYKWLMGDFGVGFLYVRRDLQEEVVKQTRYGLRQVKSEKDFDFVTHPGAAMYEGTSSMAFVPGICAALGVRYVTNIGVDAIRAHAQPLIYRLQQEVPSLGFKSITPADNPVSIVSFVPDENNEIEEVKAKLDHAFDGESVVSFRNWYFKNDVGERERVRGIRIGVSVYNNDDDIDQFLNALS